jgi:cytochrome c5
VTRNWGCFVLLALSLACAGISAATPAGDDAAAQASSSQTAAPQKKRPPVNPGQKVFETNCGRCHGAPESLSPREVRAVVRQMRVRANLSAKDEELLLKFLAP